MALSNTVVHGDVTALFRSYAIEGLTTSNITEYIANAYTFITNLLQSDHGVDPDTISADHSSRFKLCIVYKSLELIFEDLRPADEEGSRWEERQDDYEKRFWDAWARIVYSVDTDDDDETDTDISNSGTLSVSRS